MPTFFDLKCQLLHLAFSLREKGLILGKFNRLVRLLSLAIAPLLILAAVRLNDPNVLKVSIILSGLLSLAAWAWSIHSLIYRTEKHLLFCQTYPVRIETLLLELESPSSPKTKLAPRKLSAITKRANAFLLQLKEKIEEEHLTVQDWINVKAQQIVLSQTNATCASCGRKWHESSLLERKEIKKRLNLKWQKLYCLKCCQRLNIGGKK
jgi:hypothetical protein